MSVDNSDDNETILFAEYLQKVACASSCCSGELRYGVLHKGRFIVSAEIC